MSRVKGMSQRALRYRKHLIQVGGRPRARSVSFQYGNQSFAIGPEFGSLGEARWFADQFAKCLANLVDRTIEDYTVTFHAIIDKQSNAYVSSGARNAIGVTPFLYLARYFISPARAVEFLEACGFGNEFAKRFRILRVDSAAKLLGAEEQRVVEAPRRERVRSRIRRAPL